MIGDSLDSDIIGGNKNGCETILVLTGKDSICSITKDIQQPARLCSNIMVAVK